MRTKQKRSKKPQYITDENGKRVGVLLDLKTYEKLLDDLDELSCVIAYEEAKREEPNYLPLDKAFEEIEKMRAQKNKGNRKAV
jgi:PHD/YefM family antitoxin component YafN of YafNO toxin-antitoxin module